ncbi:MAG: hypothetical protein J6Z01_09695 [Bacteroidales bacterium]|nr:hypothetical protein [Bacteroidales bacterium]
MELQTIKDRVIYLIRQLNLSVAKFERTVGWSVGYVSTIKETFKQKKANEIKKVFKNVNIKFIMTGKGNLFKDNQETPLLKSEETYQGRFKVLIAKLREKGIVNSQADLAKKMGYNGSYLSTIANNRNKVPANFIEKLKLIDDTIDGEWLLNDPASAAEASESQKVLEAVNALPDTTEEPVEEVKKAPAKQAKKGKKAKGKPGRKPKAKVEVPAKEETKPAPKKEVKEKPAPAVKEKAPESEANILHPIDELLLQNRMLIAEIKKQGERVDTVLNILKSKI